MSAELRIFPEQQERVETGTIQFGSDWPGLFIRGDNALYYAYQLRRWLEGQNEDAIGKIVLAGLVHLLSSVDVRSLRSEPAGKETK